MTAQVTVPQRGVSIVPDRSASHRRRRPRTPTARRRSRGTWASRPARQPDDHLARFGDRRAAGAVGHGRTRCLGAVHQQWNSGHAASSRPGRCRRADHRPQPGDPDRRPRRTGCVHRGSLEPLVQRRHLHACPCRGCRQLGRPRLDNCEPGGGRDGQRAADCHLRPVRRHRR